jgi:hypothetical protein
MNATPIGIKNSSDINNNIVMNAKSIKTSKNTTQEHTYTHNDVKDYSDINKNIVIQMKYPRGDRLASNINRPLYLMGYAHCYRQWFCISKGSEGLANYFPGFETCPDNRNKTLGSGNIERMFDVPINRTGVYYFVDHDKGLEHWMYKNHDCAFDEAMRQKWRKMIFDASSSVLITNKTLAEEDLFETTDDPNVVTVAINIRRGDFNDWGRNLVPDETYVVMLRQLRSILEKAGKSPEVHLFSENYGIVHREFNLTTNWALYDGLVEHFHLAEDMRNGRKKSHNMDMDLNLRDWRHFIQADILIVGGTFSATPALGRPKYPDPKTGLPLTIHLYEKRDKDQSKPIYKYGWTQHDYGWVPDKLELLNLPKVFAKHDTIPVEAFFKGMTYNNLSLAPKQL